MVFPSGMYRSRTIHLKSNITLRLDSGSTIAAHDNGMDAAEPNPWDDYQGYGHSHFHNSLMWGDNISNFHITSNGTIDGGGNMITSARKDRVVRRTRPYRAGNAASPVPGRKARWRESSRAPRRAGAARPSPYR